MCMWHSQTLRVDAPYPQERYKERRDVNRWDIQQIVNIGTRPNVARSVTSRPDLARAGKHGVNAFLRRRTLKTSSTRHAPVSGIQESFD